MFWFWLIHFRPDGTNVMRMTTVYIVCMSIYRSLSHWLYFSVFLTTLVLSGRKWISQNQNFRKWNLEKIQLIRTYNSFDSLSHYQVVYVFVLGLVLLKHFSVKLNKNLLKYNMQCFLIDCKLISYELLLIMPHYKMAPLKI